MTETEARTIRPGDVLRCDRSGDEVFDPTLGDTSSVETVRSVSAYGPTFFWFAGNLFAVPARWCTLVRRGEHQP